MSKWLVSQGDHQFSARDLAELKQLAANGRIGPADMVQPPGTADWLYASEIPDLQGLLQGGGGDYDDAEFKPQRSNIPLMLAFLGIIGAGGYAIYHYANQMPAAGDLDLLGEGGLAMSEILVTEANAPVHDKPDGKSVGNLQKDKAIDLLGKREGWYHVRDNDLGLDGYVRAEHVIPAYAFADARERENYDPIYNPENYVFVKNSSWLQIDQNNKNMTIFQFMLQNKSKFEMTDLTLLATIKDKTGKELEKVEIEVGGVIPAHQSVMVGTLSPEDKSDADAVGEAMTTYSFDKLAEDDEDLQLRWSDGVEVEMQEKGFTEANIDILELRAVPLDKG
jgi:hypothetical protein